MKENAKPDAEQNTIRNRGTSSRINQELRFFGQCRFHECVRSCFFSSATVGHWTTTSDSRSRRESGARVKLEVLGYSPCLTASRRGIGSPLSPAVNANTSVQSISRLLPFSIFPYFLPSLLHISILPPFLLNSYNWSFTRLIDNSCNSPLIRLYVF